MIEKIEQKLEAYRKRKEELLKEIQQDFPEVFKEEMQKLKVVESISWTQFTDYFNDGEECEFGVHTDLDYSVEINGERLDDLNSDDDENPLFCLLPEIYCTITEENFHLHEEAIKGKTWINRPEKIGEKSYIVNTQFDKEERSVVEKILGLIDNLGEEFLKDLFGDHKRITITKDGKIDVEDFTDHD